MHRVLTKLSALFRKNKLDRDMAEEMRFHLVESADEQAADGLSSDDARYAAQRKFGNVGLIQETARDQRGFVWLEQSLQDLRYAARTLRKNLGFTAVVTLTLALCIGLNTVVFTFYNAVALKPLAVRDPAQIVRVVATDGRRTELRFTSDEFAALAARAQSFTAVLATSQPQPLPMARVNPRSAHSQIVNVRLVSANYFPALGVVPVLGRSFGANDPVGAVLSYDFWVKECGADSTVLGQTVAIRGVPITILGVAPASFAGTGLPANTPDLWLPLSLQPAVMPSADWLHGDARHWQILARRKPGVTSEQAGAELQLLLQASSLHAARPMKLSAWPATFFQTETGEFQAFRVVVLIVMVAVGMILLIGCVNVLNLLAARHAAREHELAVRLALGAGRRRLVRQLCTESVLLALLGGAGGLILSWCFCGLLRVWVVETFKRLSAGAVSVFLNVTPDWRVFAYTLGLSLLAGVVVGLWPALRATRGDLERGLKQDATGAGRGPRSAWSRRNLLLTAQVAASLVLLAGAGLAFRGALHARDTDPGYDTKRLFVLSANLEVIAPDEAARTALIRDSVARLAAAPEIASVAWADHPPLLGHAIWGFRNPHGTVDRWVLNRVSGDFFDTVGLPIVAGRTFTPQELEQDAAVAVINESAARQYWPGQNPIGRPLPYKLPHNLPLSWENRTSTTTFTVVGVIQDARLTQLTKPDKIDVFLPQPKIGAVIVRSRVAPDVALPAIYAALGAVNADLPAQTTVLSLDQGAVRLQQLMSDAPAVAASTLGIIALLLASVGIYGVVSFVVARRTREIGIHLALGAQKREVVAMVLRQVLRPALWGAALGLIGAVGLSVLLAKLLTDPELPDFTAGAGPFPLGTLLAVLGTLLVVIVTAAFIPARRATKVDPMVALRCE